MKAMASKRRTMRALTARSSKTVRNRKSTNSFQTWKVVTKKSYTAEMPVAWRRSFACEPPFSPVTRTSVMAVASGIGELPVHVPDEIAAKGNDEQHAEGAAGEADEDRLPGMRDRASGCREPAA